MDGATEELPVWKNWLLSNRGPKVIRTLVRPPETQNMSSNLAREVPAAPPGPYRGPAGSSSGSHGLVLDRRPEGSPESVGVAPVKPVGDQDAFDHVGQDGTPGSIP